MPCVGFHCPGNPFLWRAIDDCEKCDHKCLSIESLRYIWQTEFIDGADHYHNDNKAVSVTETMGCLRKAYFDRFEDYAEEPERFLARVNGTALHAARERANDDGCSEVALSVELGGGYALKGTADRLTDEYVADYKTMDNPRKTYDDNNAVQMSTYDEMAGGKPRKLLVIQCGRRSEAVHEVHRVDGALETAKRRAHELINAIDEGDPSLLETEGREMTIKFIGKSVCDYCPHADVCGAVDSKEAVND